MFTDTGSLLSSGFLTLCFFGFLPAAMQSMSVSDNTLTVLEPPPQPVAVFLSSAPEAMPVLAALELEEETLAAPTEASQEKGVANEAPALGDRTRVPPAPPILASASTQPPPKPGTPGLADGTAKASSTKLEKKVEQPTRKRRKKCGTYSNPEIHSQSLDRWFVTRSIVDHHTQSIQHMMGLGWSGPYNEDGVKGWQISSFSCKSDLYIGGLRRKDVILSVNGKPTKNVIQLYGMYKKLRRTDAFEIVLLRNGKLRTLRYTVVDQMPTPKTA
jgi:hypothetical protein